MCSAAFIPFVTTGLGLLGQSEASKASRRAASRNIANVQRSKANQIAQVESKFFQEAVRLESQREDIAGDSAKTKSITKVSAAESGIKGISLEAILSDIERQEGEFLTSLNLSEEFLKAERIRQLRDVETIGRGRIAAIEARIIPKPSIFSIALGFGAAFAQSESIRAAQLE